MIRVQFTQNQFTGRENTGLVLISIELVGGYSANAFNMTITLSEQSPVSAEGT